MHNSSSGALIAIRYSFELSTENGFVLCVAHILRCLEANERRNWMLFCARVLSANKLSVIYIFENSCYILNSTTNNNTGESVRISPISILGHAWPVRQRVLMQQQKRSERNYKMIRATKCNLEDVCNAQSSHFAWRFSDGGLHPYQNLSANDRNIHIHHPFFEIN